MMKKLLIAFAAAFLASCSSPTQDKDDTSTVDKDAAAEFCECVNAEDAAETTDFMELMEVTDKRTACINTWQAKYNGKITAGFKDILKESCPDGYSQLEAMGMFN
jgi:hypothetical protein